MGNNKCVEDQFGAYTSLAKCEAAATEHQNDYSECDGSPEAETPACALCGVFNSSDSTYGIPWEDAPPSDQNDNSVISHGYKWCIGMGQHGSCTTKANYIASSDHHELAAAQCDGTSYTPIPLQ